MTPSLPDADQLLSDTEPASVATGPASAPLPDPASSPRLEESDEEARASALRAVLAPDFSRNKHFSFFAQRTHRRLIGFRRTVQGLELDVARVGEGARLCLKPEEDGQHVWLELRIDFLHALRRCRLDRAEVEALGHHPTLGPLLHWLSPEE